MYEHVRGTLEAKTPVRAVVDVGGVGYALTIPLSTYERLPDKGGKVKLLTTLVVRDDAHRLFGFATAVERAFFDMLLSVSGVGPAVALGIVSSLPFDGFRSAVLADDAASLRRVKGVGKRLSERLVVELRDVLKQSAPSGVPDAPQDTDFADALLALEALGFARAAAREALLKCQADHTGPGDLVRRALKLL